MKRIKEIYIEIGSYLYLKEKGYSKSSEDSFLEFPIKDVKEFITLAETKPDFKRNGLRGGEYAKLIVNGKIVRLLYIKPFTFEIIEVKGIKRIKESFPRF